MADVSKKTTNFSWHIAISGIIVSCLLWYLSLKNVSLAYFITSLGVAFPWVILVAGIAISILIAVFLRVADTSKQRAKLFDRANQDFESEIKKEISERIHAEESKQKLERALLQGQKLQAIGTLAGGIAHDFNNILYAIIGYVEMAREDVEQNTIVHNNLGKVLEASQRGRELISRILAFSRRQHHDYKPTHLQETLESVLALLKPTIPASVTIQLSTMPEDCMIWGDQTQLHQVVVNIINNAVDAMDGEGVITLQLSDVSEDDEILKEFPSRSDCNYCQIIINDTGHGMDQSTIARIFEPFFTTKEVGKGTGLGLATVHAIMKEHQGEIKVNSQIGKGTSFTLLLPKHNPKRKNSHG